MRYRPSIAIGDVNGGRIQYVEEASKSFRLMKDRHWQQVSIVSPTSKLPIYLRKEVR